MKKSFLVVICLVCAVFVAGPANAVTLGLTDLIGTVVPGSPADEANELARLNQLITRYNADLFAPVTIGLYTYDVSPGSQIFGALPTATGGVHVDTAGVIPFDLTSPYLYLMAKFGNQDAFYFLNGQTGTLTDLVSPFPAKGGGLSHLTLFNPTQVPEAGALLLFGTGLIGLVGYRRARRMQ